MSSYDGTEATMVPGTLRGYRAWRVTVNGLESITFQHVWGNTERARCTRYDPKPIYSHNAPVSGCTCGIYAKHTLEELEYEYGYRGLMLGSIRAHGRIILGDRGFRAEHAEIEALLWRGSPITTDSRDLLKVLHSVPFYMGYEEGFLKDYPPIPVDHLLPKKPPIDQRMDWSYLDPVTAQRLWEIIRRSSRGLEWKVEE